MKYCDRDISDVRFEISDPNDFFVSFVSLYLCGDPIQSFLCRLSFAFGFGCGELGVVGGDFGDGDLAGEG